MDKVEKGAPRTPLERMADLTRRVVAVPKSEAVKAKVKRAKRKPR